MISKITPLTPKIRYFFKLANYNTHHSEIKSKLVEAKNHGIASLCKGVAL